MVEAGGEPVCSNSPTSFFTDWLTGKKATKAKGTFIHYSGVLGNFLTLIGEARAEASVGAISPTEVQKFRDAAIKAGKTATSANFDLKMLRTVFGAARRQGIIAHDPADLFRHVYAEQTPDLRRQQQELSAELAAAADDPEVAR